LANPDAQANDSRPAGGEARKILVYSGPKESSHVFILDYATLKESEILKFGTFDIIAIVSCVALLASFSDELSFELG
jgi:hypothetical protein